MTKGKLEDHVLTITISKEHWIDLISIHGMTEAEAEDFLKTEGLRVHVAQEDMENRVSYIDRVDLIIGE
jgi:beta-lactam-binding protein with PASTA domain